MVGCQPIEQFLAEKSVRWLLKVKAAEKFGVDF